MSTSFNKAIKFDLNSISAFSAEKILAKSFLYNIAERLSVEYLKKCPVFSKNESHNHFTTYVRP